MFNKSKNETKMRIFNEFCKNKKCSEYIEWQSEGYCTSCKLVGESYNITEYPKDCLFLDDIKKFESEHDGSRHFTRPRNPRKH